jgi:hypothetical protein
MTWLRTREHGSQPTIDIDNLPGYERGFIRAKERNGCCDILRVADPADRGICPSALPTCEGG